MRKGFFCVFAFPIRNQNTNAKHNPLHQGEEGRGTVGTAAVLKLRKDMRWQICEAMPATQCA